MGSEGEVNSPILSTQKLSISSSLSHMLPTFLSTGVEEVGVQWVQAADAGSHVCQDLATAQLLQLPQRPGWGCTRGHARVAFGRGVSGGRVGQHS